jgi:hypothetical protein
MERVFPIIIIALEAIAGLVYLGYGDIRMAIYWIGAGICFTCVIWK